MINFDPAPIFDFFNSTKLPILLSPQALYRGEFLHMVPQLNFHQHDNLPRENARIVNCYEFPHISKYYIRFNSYIAPIFVSWKNKRFQGQPYLPHFPNAPFAYCIDIWIPPLINQFLNHNPLLRFHPPPQR